MRIKNMIEKAWEEGTFNLTPRIQMSYVTAVQNALIRQWIEPKHLSEWDRPSSWSCARKKAFIKHGYPEEQFPMRTIGNFWLGDLYETAFVTLALMAGAPIKYGLADQLELNTVVGKGHPDGIVIWPDTPKEVLEVKKMAPYPGFNDFKKCESISDLSDTFGYRSQICMYADGAIQEGLIEPEGLIRYVAINASNFEICEKEFKYDPDLVAKCKKEASAIRKSKTPYELPSLPRETVEKTGMLKTPTTCRFCSHAANCWENEGYRFDGGALTLLS
jgi:hypothetical protein